jgi:hypothetical protein
MVDPLVKVYIESEFAKLNSKNKLTLEDLHGGKPWVADHKHWNYEAAKKATEVRSAIRCRLLSFRYMSRPFTIKRQTSLAREVRSP